MADVKSDMMRLWKDTFHDPDRYIRLVFDTYFDPSNISVRYDGNRIVAALLGVPYRFRVNPLPPVDKKSVESTRLMHGLYLCGLATRPEYRRQGIMASMMDEIQSAADDRKFDFTFLIPADDHLREYYRKRGYLDFSRRVGMRLRRIGRMGECRPYLVRSLLEKGDMDSVRNLAYWCIARESETCTPCLLHSADDMMAALTENENAIFFIDCASDCEYPNLANLVAVGFPDEIGMRLTEETLGSDPSITYSFDYRKIFIDVCSGMCHRSSLPSREVIETTDYGPYAMAHILSSHGIPEVAFPSFSISLLLD